MVGQSGTKLSNGMARSRIDFSYVFIRNVSLSSVSPNQASKMSKLTATTPLRRVRVIIEIVFGKQFGLSYLDVLTFCGFV